MSLISKAFASDSIFGMDRLTDLTLQTAFWEMGRERHSAESHFLEPDICTARRESEYSEPNPAF
jgi:hypothetical protein